MSEAFSEKLTRRVSRFAFRKDANIAPARPIVTFTFDDIPRSAATAGAPSLERHGLHGTFYVAGGLIDRQSDYDEICASAEQIAHIAASGHEIACHTYAHRVAKAHTITSLDEDLDRNSELLRRLTGCGPLENFAFPLNSPTLAAKRHLKSRYRSIRSGCPAVNRGRTDLMQLKSVSLEAEPVGGRTSTEWIADTARHGGWLIFFTHDVRDGHSIYGTTPRILDVAIDAALASGCEIMTMSRALDACGIPPLAVDVLAKHTISGQDAT